jgi:UDP-N-acetylglucosamine diphosphorylase / glucose-1-phosphate thymidylyltransferase / UDP-N-acetylgalactosamine diphosphorylase / glucosamine-1-phosphate N-acetyltransferase / galactosamine-1-phosphate N-acetyltransferase
MLKQQDFFDLEGNRLKGLFKNTEFVWEGLKNIKEYIKENIAPNVSGLRKGSFFLNKEMVIYNGEVLESGFSIDIREKTVIKDGRILKGASIIFSGVSLMDDEIYIGKSTVIEPGALIKGPAIIGDNNEIRQGAYIRGNVIIGDECVVGHNTEMKNAVMLGGSKAGHFAYIGDSILGRVNLGAGTKLANLKMVDSKIDLLVNGKKYETGLRKFGAIFADGVETGCNSVAMPGSLLSRNVLLYPNTTARGYYPPYSIIKLKNITETRKRR